MNRWIRRAAAAAAIAVLVGVAHAQPFPGKPSSTMLAVLAKPDVREKIAAAGVDVDPLDSAGLAQAIDAEIKRWARWVKDANIQPE